MPEISDLQKDAKSLVRGNRALSVRETLEKQAVQLRDALPPNISTKRFLRVIYTQLHKNPRLQECSKESLLASVFTAAERGLLPNGQSAALVPYWNSHKRVREAQYQPMFQGLIYLSKKYGDVIDIWAATIRENDEWSYDLGLHADLVHKPAQSNRGAPIAYYCIIELPNGKRTFGPGIMTVEEVEQIRARSKSKDDGPWVTDPEPMAWKTVIKRNLKYIGVSPELQEHLIEDDEAEYGQMDVSAPIDDRPVYTAEEVERLRQSQNEPEDTGEPEPDKPLPTPERAQQWPHWDENNKVWRDSAYEAYNPELHSKPMKCNEKDGKWRKRRQVKTKAEPELINEDGTLQKEPESQQAVGTIPDLPSGEPGPDVPF